MIILNTKNVFYDPKDLAKLQPKISKIFEENIINRNGLGSEFMDWIEYYDNYPSDELNNIENKIKSFKELGIETLLVVGIGGSFLGSQAGIDFVKGKLSSRDKVLYIGTDISHSHIKQVEEFLSNKKWALCVISKSGGTLEPSLAFNYFNNKLETLYGKEHNKYVVAITGQTGILKKFADSRGYQTFNIPDGIGGRFSGMTSVGLFPMMFAGLNIRAILEGAKQAKKDLWNSNLEENSAFKYAALRFILNSKPITNEIFVSYDYDLDMFGEWVKQLFGESEGKNGKGLFPISIYNTRDLHSLGQIIQDGPKTFFETNLWIEEDFSKSEKKYIKSEKKNLYQLNHLVDISIDEINEKVFDAVVKAHYEEGKISNIILKTKGKTEKTLGYIFFWYFMVVTMSGYMLEVNPFDQPGVEIYKKNVNENLKK